MLAHRSGVAALTQRAPTPAPAPTSPLPPFPRSGILSFEYQRTPTHRHQGIDLPAPEGTSLYATEAGTVTHAAAQLAPGFSGYGGHVVVHDGQRWQLYGHLARVDVAPGEHVKRGQLIGTVGRTCYTREDPTKLCERPHLHFEVSPRAYPQDSEAKRIDPVAWLEERNAHPMASRTATPSDKAQPVRLLDVFVLGPAMALGGAQLLGRSRPLGTLLVTAGVLTVAYNGANYLRTRRRNEPA